MIAVQRNAPSHALSLSDPCLITEVRNAMQDYVAKGNMAALGLHLIVFNPVFRLLEVTRGALLGESPNDFHPDCRINTAASGPRKTGCIPYVTSFVARYTFGGVGCALGALVGLGAPTGRTKGWAAGALVGEIVAGTFNGALRSLANAGMILADIGLSVGLGYPIRAAGLLLCVATAPIAGAMKAWQLTHDTQ